MRPNGSEGYVHADDVRLMRVHTRIIVDLSERELVARTVTGEPVLRTRRHRRAGHADSDRAATT